jgi:hypothetical protein
MNLIYSNIPNHQIVNLDKLKSISIVDDLDIDFKFKGSTITWRSDTEEEKKIFNVSSIITSI